MSLTIPLVAQEPDFDPLGEQVDWSTGEKQIRIVLEYVEVPHETVTEILAEEHQKRRISSNANALRERVQNLITEKKAALIETAYVLARSGQRAKVESIQEFIYPTEYDPPEGEFEVTRTRKTGEKSTSSVTEEVSASLPTPTAFETRNVGITLEVDPVLGADGRTIDLNLAPEIVYPVGETEWGTYRNAESSVEVKMPMFYAVKTTTQVTIIDGEYLLFGIHTPVNVETKFPDFSRKLLLFLKADLVYVGMPVEEETKR